MLVGAWLIAILGFGIYWNNSDDQFYFQLAVAFGALVTTVPVDRRHAGLLLLGCAPLLWNAAESTTARVMYPRQELTALLATNLAGTGLLVYPGQEEVDQLRQLMKPKLSPSKLLSITSLAELYGPAGLDTLDARMARMLGQGGRIDIVNVYDVPDYRQPWTALREMGYSHDTVRARLDRFTSGARVRRVDRFTFLSIQRRPPYEH
jgi:hypothetical protein